MKKETNVVWRDKNGTIRCLGDDCKQKKCDDTCPIWRNTIASGMITIREYKKAIKVYEEIVDVAPDYIDVWNNMGMCYGMLDQHEKARECYEKAYNLGGRSQALHGLIIATKKCGKYEEALKLCEEYEKKFDGQDIAEAKAKIISEKNSKNSTIVPALDILKDLLKSGKEAGFVRDVDTFPNIPEIMVEASNVVRKIFNEMNGKYENSMFLVFAWSLFAGFGAVYAWNSNWDELKRKGIYEKLTEERGIEAMDDYVMETAGWMEGSEKREKFNEHLYIQGGIAITPADDLTDDMQIMQQLAEGLKAMYYYGMVVAMNDLGMF